MTWLFASRLRPFLLLAAAASLLLNIAMLVPALYMTQVFDRVFASRSVETLVMLVALAVLALALMYAMDTLRARTLAFAGRVLEERLAPVALADALRDAVRPGSGRADTEALRDVARLRAFLGRAGHPVADGCALAACVPAGDHADAPRAGRGRGAGRAGAGERSACSPNA
jgi:ABC-type protease/lipase transport system fused ATPase/permease subunit